MHLYLSNLVILIFILGIFFELNANSLEILIFIAKIWDSKIYDVYRIGTGTGIEKNWYRKKVSEPVSEKFGTEKSTGIGIENIWYRKKVSVSVSFNILGTVTHWPSYIFLSFYKSSYTFSRSI